MSIENNCLRDANIIYVCYGNEGNEHNTTIKIFSITIITFTNENKI